VVARRLNRESGLGGWKYPGKAPAGMLLEALFSFALALCGTTALAVLPGMSWSRIWVGLPLGLAALALAGFVLALTTGDQRGAEGFGILAAAGALVARMALPRWSWLASQLLATVVLAALAYLAYAAALTLYEGLDPFGMAASIVLLLLEAAVLGLSIYYAFEVLDVLGRRGRAPHLADPAYRPPVAIQVPTYNEPVEVVSRTLESLARLDYPNFIVQVVDNNTRDAGVWRPIELRCRQLGPRFRFIHLSPWPGYKAGALNEATRRLPPEVEVIGVVDADYVVDRGWLRDVAGHFADPGVAFVQTPQDYQEWEDDRYLRGLYYSYDYFFAVSMPARAHRDAIIFAGTMGLIRRAALEEIGGWDESCITEDAEASLRMLDRGRSGVYVPTSYGHGMMPLTFDGLKKQRFRWALGGIQILRLHWRELAGLRGGMTWSQRVQYLFGSLHWFGDLLMVFFTVLLLATALSVATYHQLPLRRMTGTVLVIPLAFLVTGLGRALWALKASTSCGWRDALGAMRVWFALSWIDALACIRGLLRYQTVFLRTPKVLDGQASWVKALWTSRTESLLAALLLAGVAAMLIRDPTLTTGVLAVLMVWQASVYGNAPLASIAAEGIRLTPLRRRYLSSAQNTGERPSAVGRTMLLPAAALLGGLAVLVIVLLTRPASQAVPPVQNPVIVPPAQASTPTPTPPATPTPTVSATTTPAASSPRVASTPR
jgi:cellulose synthase/poly-beta-1,6-N-acetylglucosamine synthase-like glycosyltransferase